MQVKSRFVAALVPFVYFVLTSLAIAADGVTPSNAGGVGTFDGAKGWADEATGASQASYSFELLAARGTAQPRLQLSYSSNSGAREAGFGWGFDLPTIERKPLQGGAPKYDDWDRLAFNGQALVFIRTVDSTSSTMRNGTVESLPPRYSGWRYYRAQDDAHMRFFWSPDRRTWAIQAPTGTTLELGFPLRDPSPENNDAAVEWGGPNGEIHRWRLVRQFDAHANVVIYHWHNLGRMADEMLALTDIYDTSAAGGAVNLATFAHHTHIAYETSPSAGNPAVNTVGYAKPWKQAYQIRVKRIDVAGNGHDATKGRALVRRYHLTYQDYLRRSLLTSITQEGAACATALEAPAPPGPHGGTSDYEAPETACPRLPPTTFEYSTPAWQNSLGGYLRGDSINPPPAGKLFPGGYSTNVIDVNRDGALDLVQQPPPGQYGTGRVYLTQVPQGGKTYVRYFPLENAYGNVLTTQAGFTLIDSADLRNTPSALWRVEDDTRPIPDRESHKFRITPSGTGFTWTKVSEGTIPVGAIAVGDIDGSGAPDILESHTARIGSENPRNVTLTAARNSARYTFAPNAGHPNVDAAPTWAYLHSELHLTNQTPISVRYDSNVPFYALADLNGDGMDDLVTLKAKPGATGNQYEFQPYIYYPGTGDGHFICNTERSVCNVPPPCEVGAGTWEGTTTGCGVPWIDIQSTSSTQDPPTPFSWDTRAPTVFVDINKDGLVDILKGGTKLVEGDAIGFVTIWLNDDGVHFHEVETSTIGVMGAGRLITGDMNANGTTDIVFLSSSDRAQQLGAEGGYMEFFQLEYPGLLKKITNGLGATTTFKYDTIRNLAAGDAFDLPWASPSPVPMHLVTEVINTQPRVGNPNESGDGVTTQYKYRDAAFDTFENRVTGFRQVEVSNSRGSSVRTKYYFGHCQPATGTCNETSDLDFERSFTGRPYQTDIIGIDNSIYSTNLTHYRVVSLYKEGGTQLPEQELREVAFTYPDSVETYLYETGTVAEVSEYAPHHVVDDTRVPTIQAPLASATGRVHIRREQVQDAFGNVVSTRDFGRLGTDIDIGTAYAIVPVADSDIFAFRTATRTLIGSGGEPDRVTTFTYTPAGDVTDVRATLVGTLPLVRSHEKGIAIAPPPSRGSVDGEIKLAHLTYDDFGNVRSGYGPGGTGCFQISYDGDDTNSGYHHLPLRSTRFKQGCDGESFTTAWNYDGKFDVVAISHHGDGSVSTSAYDEFGRVRTASANDPDLLGTPGIPSEFAYYLSATTNQHAMSIKSPVGGGETAVAWQLSDGFGQPIASAVQGDPSTGEASPWIVLNATYYQTARPSWMYRPYGSVDDPASLNFKYLPPFGDGTVNYDVFGRVTLLTDKGRRIAFKYHPMSVETYDEEDLGTGSHANTPSVVTFDGHGRRTASIAQNGSSGGIDLIQTKFEYNRVGQVTKITRSHSQGPETFTRWMKYDSLGRLVLNAEPNTSKNFVAEPNDPAALTSMRAWRYAYDDAGRLVGTSDARGCGKNLFYDGLGRILAEDYSPCLAHHEPYTAIDLVKGTGAEAIYEYDSVGPLNSLAYQGRLTSVADRGALTHFGYDARGRLRATARRITRPASDGRFPDSDFGGLDLELGIGIHIEIGGGGDSTRDRYGKHVFKKGFTYDLLDRVIAEDSGADVEELLGSDGRSSVKYSYSKRGLLKSVDSSYGPLIASIKYNIDGTPALITYGDAAGTTADMRYNDHDLAKLTVSRTRPDLWTKETEFYSPADPTVPSSLQTILTDLEFSYDAVGNPTAIMDKRNPDEWPAGAKPRSQTLVYDDLYRLMQERAVHSPAGDRQVSPVGKEEHATFSAVLPQLTRAKRSTGFDIAYDWMGNTTSLLDSDETVLDRSSLGAVTNGDASGGHPNQLTASSLGIRVLYDETGNVVDMLVPRTGQCGDGSQKCSHHFIYNWDEVGQLVRARRWDYKDIPADEVRYPNVPFPFPNADVRYAYSQGQRVLKSIDGRDDFKHHSAEIFSTLRLDNADWSIDDYEVNSATESAYLGGVAHVLVSEDDLPAMSRSSRHVFLLQGDRLGSASVVIDLDTGELAENVQYHPYGTVDSDYRPTRWGSHREPYQFTGKEADIEVGLTYFGARYYSTGLARWLSADPLTTHAAGSDLNPYAYVHGSPVNRVDPTGLCDELYSSCPHGSGFPGDPPHQDSNGYGSYEIYDRPSIPKGGGAGPAAVGSGSFYSMPEFSRGSARQSLAPPPPPAVTAGPASGTFGAGGQFGLDTNWFKPRYVNASTVAEVADEFNAGIDKNATVIVGTGGLAVSQAAVLGGAALLEAAGVGLSSLPASGAAQASQVGTDVLSAINGNPIPSAVGGGILWLGAKNSGDWSRVLHASQIEELGAKEGTIVLGHYTRPIFYDGMQVGVQDTLQTLDAAATQLGGRTLSSLPGDMAAIAPHLKSASRIVFFTSTGMRGLTAAEMQMIQQDPALRSKAIFIFGGF